MNKKIIYFIIFLLFTVLFSAGAQTQDEPLQDRPVTAIEVKGIKVVGKEKVISQIKTRIGQPYNKNISNEDMNRLYALDFFERIEVQLEDFEKGVKVTFHVTEKPLLKKIEIEGSRKIGKKKILDTLNLKEGSFLDEFKVKEAVDNLKSLYGKRGFTESSVEYQIVRDEAKNEAVVQFLISEFKKFKIRKVELQGNSVFRSKRIFKLLKTRPAWLFNAGLFKEETANDDIKRLEDFYRREGYGDAKAVYTTKVDKEKGFVFVTFQITEGRKYLVGDVTIDGNEKIPGYKITDTLTLRKNGVFSQVAAQAEASRIQQVYVDEGYIFAQVKPVSYLNPKSDQVDIAYKIKENNLAYVNRIDIRGNLKTRDNVIRRELRIFPGDKFSGDKIRRSKEKLQNLGFFEEIKFDTESTEKPDWQDLVVHVKEAKTGSFSFGGGYSSVEQLIGFIELRQKNFDYKNFPYFTGGGQDLSFFGQFGSNATEYELSFTNPWIFDRPISFGFDIYQREHDRESDVGYGYDELRRGGKIRLGKELNEYLKGGLAYKFETVEISDVDPSATNELKKEIGKNNISSMEYSLTLDKRDNPFFPTKGFYATSALETAGSFLGGDKDYVKLFSQGSFFVPLFRGSVVELKGRVGLAKPIDDTEDIPIYERFFAGGAYTIRGYHERKVGPIDAVTNDPIGGEALFIGNIEYTYPLTEYLRLAAFFDTGNVWTHYDELFTGSFKSSFGLGVRVKTPFGPINVDYGYPLADEPGEEGKSGKFHFSVSRGF